VIHIVPNSRNLPAEFSETRYPIRVEQLALCRDSGGVGRMRGGLGYDKRIRALQDVELLSNADRSLMNTYGLNGGSPGGRYSITVTSPEGDEREVAGLADGVSVPTGSVVRITTTGGGGWGDPLEREVEAVRWDIIRGIVSPEAAANEYGVLFREGEELEVDMEATERRRAELRSARTPLRMFERGEHYDELARQGELGPRPEGWPADPDAVDDSTAIGD